MKETSSESTEEPKIKFGLQDKYKKEAKGEPEPLNPENIKKHIKEMKRGTRTNIRKS